MSEYRFRYTDASGTVTTGGTSQEVFAANVSRKALFIQNHPAETEVLYVNYTSAASESTPGSIGLGPGDAIDLSSKTGVTIESVNVVASDTGHKFVAKQAL